MPPMPSPNQLPAINIPTPAAPQPAPTAPASGITAANVALIAFTAVASAVMALIATATLIAAVIHFGGFWPTPHPGPAPVVDPAFVKLGQTIAKTLAPNYGSAWGAYANEIDAGKPLSEAFKAQIAAWKASRDAVFTQHLTPEFSKILPEGTTDDKVTPAQRAAMSAAGRGLQKGLSEP